MKSALNLARDPDPGGGMDAKRWLLELVLVCALGFLALSIPVLAGFTKTGNQAAFLPFVRDVVEGMGGLAIGLLFLVTVVAGFVCRAPALLIGPASVAVLPLWALMDMVLGGSHNLFPIEFFFYGVEAAIGTAGALLGRLPRTIVSAVRTRE
jgi:hypothetical protein